ncbi:MAG: DUF3052 family protein [Chloroflexi bacterium]|nr:DUF3052 family protein [Chloroflexota bacterium]
MTSGYSKTPLARKLGIKPGSPVLVVNGPGDYLELLDPLPEGVVVTSAAPTRKQIGVGDTAPMAHMFTKSRDELESLLPALMDAIPKNGMIWISWPKKASKVPTDVTEDVIREVALPLGLVDTKVCAVDDTWSGLRLVYRKENR